MIKGILLASAMTIAAPALAQTMQPGTDTTTSATGQASTMPATPPTSGASTTPSQAQPSTTAQTTTADPAMSTPAQQSAQTTGDSAEPATSTTQVASVVDNDFATYDKDGSGTLSKAEFAAWMNALKAKQPGGAGATADPKWNDAAFAQADTDKSKVLSKAELTAFLGGGNQSS